VLIEARFPIPCFARTTLFSYSLLYILSIHTHDIDDYMETNNHKDRLNRLRLRLDDRNDPCDRDDYMETNNHKDRLNRLRLRSDDRNDPYDRDDYMETRL